MLRLALTGQLGDDAFASDDMGDAMALCVGCKACKSECPMSIDMAKMKTEVQSARAAKNGVAMREKLIAALPRMAPISSAFLPVSNLALNFGHLFGFDKTRRLPNFQKPYSGPETGDVLLFADTFNRYFDPRTLRAAERVIAATGKTVGS